MHWKNDLTAPVPLPNLRSSFFTNLGSHLWHPQPPPVTCWPRLCCGSERERESALCVLQIYDLKCDFEKRIWRNIFCLCLCQRLGLRLLVSSFRLPSFRLTFHFCRSHSIFFLFFYFFLCCPFADKHIRVLLFLLFFVFFCALYLFHFYLFALWGCWFVGYVDDAVLFVKHAKRCFDSRTRAWAGQPQSGRSSLKTLTQSKVE